jgi:glycosyltransferase involved in cell wall biosynthesis
MKILIATGIYPPDIGGPATYSAIVLKELRARGHSVCVVTYGTSEKWRVKSDKNLITISRRLPKGIRHLVYFWRVLRHSKDADIIFAQDPVSVGVPALYAARITRKKFVLKIVGDYAWEQGTARFGVTELLDDFLRARYGFRVELLRRLERCVARRAALIIVPSEYLKNVVAQWNVGNVPIEVVYNGINTPTAISKEDARKALGISGTVLVSVGRLVPWKGFAMLVGLMQKLAPVKLIILGEGPDRVALEGLRDRLKLADSVFMPGAVSQEVLAQYLASADAFLLNTGYEGYSHQLLEAMAMGVPVVTTLAGGNKEIVRNEINALVAGYNDTGEWEMQVKKILSDSALAQKISHEAKKQVELYSTTRMIEQTIKILERI